MDKSESNCTKAAAAAAGNKMQVYLSLGDAEFRMHKFKSSLYYFKKALAISTELDNGYSPYTFQEANINFKIGSCLLCLLQNSDALYSFMRANSICELGLRDLNRIPVLSEDQMEEQDSLDSLHKRAELKVRDVYDVLVPIPGEPVKDVLKDILPPIMRDGSSSEEASNSQ